MGNPSQKVIPGHGLVFGVTLKIIASILIPVCFCVSAAAQTDDQLKYFADRIEFGTDDVKRDALQALQRFNTESASRVAARGLKDPSPVIRATAIGAVVSLPISDASALLVPFLRSSLPFIRKEAAHALAKVRDPDTAADLIGLLQRDRKGDVRAAAAFALGTLGNVEAVQPLTALLSKKPKSSHAFLRRSAARSIGQIAELISNREITVNTPENFLPDDYKSSGRLKAAGNEFAAAAAVLERVLANTKESNDTRRDAAFALGAIGGAGSVPVLRRFAVNEDYFLAEICREALLKIAAR